MDCTSESITNSHRAACAVALERHGSPQAELLVVRPRLDANFVTASNGECRFVDGIEWVGGSAFLQVAVVAGVSGHGTVREDWTGDPGIPHVVLEVVIGQIEAPVKVPVVISAGRAGR